MRFGLLIATVALSTLLLGGSCQPFIDNAARTATPGQKVSVNLSQPAKDSKIAQGTTVSIAWEAVNLTGEPGTVTFHVESRNDLSQTALPTSYEVGASGGSGTFQWDTTGFSGMYAIVAHLQAGGTTTDATAAGRISVIAPPTLAFTAPAGNVSFDPNKDGTLSIAWTDKATPAAGRIGLDADTDHKSGNEIFLHDFTPPEPNDPNAQPTTAPANTLPTTGTGSFQWNGKDGSGVAVGAGTYNLFASVTDNVNPVLYFDGLGQITISTSTEPNQPASTPKITAPATDTTFLTTTPTLTIQYAVNQKTDVLVDLKIDTDDTHTNGNERTILFQQLVAANATPDPFDWTGTDHTGVAVADGIYRLFVSVSTGSGTPQTTDGPGLILRRSDPNEPLIGLLAPAAVTKIGPGQTVLISWRDNDPTGGAKIHLVVADSSNPADHESDTAILSDRSAAQGGVGDTFSWQVPLNSGLTPSIPYYVIAYIANADGALKSNSVAAGWLVLNDPNAP